MASLKCLACGHDNKVGDESCASCSSSLNLRLCSACEAINANSAERCHSCGAQFDAEAEAASLVEEAARETPPEEKVLPAAWVVGAGHATRRGRRATAALWLVAVLAGAGVAYYYSFDAPQAAVKQVAAVPPAAAAQIVEVKVPPKLKPPPAVVQTFEPKRALAPVTHTRAGSVATPIKAEWAPAVTPTVGEPAPVAIERRGRVTHTKAEPSDAAVGGASAPNAPAKVQPGCAPEVIALGLCKSN